MCGIGTIPCRFLPTEEREDLLVLAVHAAEPVLWI